MNTRKWLAECHAWLDDPTSVQFEDGGVWNDAAEGGFDPLGEPEFNWRIKPATITINGTELPKPTTVSSSISPQFVLSIDGHYGNPVAYFYFNTREDRDLVYSKLVGVLGS